MTERCGKLYGGDNRCGLFAGHLGDCGPKIPPVSDAPSGAHEREQKDSGAELIHQVASSIEGTEPRLSPAEVSALTRKQIIEHARAELRALHADMDSAVDEHHRLGHSRTANTIGHYKNRLLFVLKNLGGNPVGYHGKHSVSGSEPVGTERSAGGEMIQPNSGVSSTAQHVEQAIEAMDEAMRLYEREQRWTPLLDARQQLISAVQAQAREMELDNHHNAATCPYCRPTMMIREAEWMQRFHDQKERAEAAEARLALMETPQE